MIKFMRFLPFLFIAAGLLVMMGLWSGAAQAGSVEAVRFGHHPDKVRMVLEMKGTTPYRVFSLSSPPRVVIDMPAASWNVDAVAKSQVPAIVDVRHGYPRPDVSRIVIDLKQHGGLRSAFQLPAAGGKPDRLVVDFSLMSESEFQAVKLKTFGDFTPSPGAAQTTPPKGIKAPKIVTQQAPKVVTQPQPQQQAALSQKAVPLPEHKPAAMTNNSPVSAPAKTVRKPMIIIDPGHGGVDPGAIGANGVFEKHVTLAAARELKKQLLATGRYRVKMTREKDVYLKLYQRVAFARKHEGDLFISLHADSIRKSTVSGASVYTLSEKASDTQTAALAARENRSDLIAGVDLTHEDQDVAGILVDLVMRDTMNQSIFLANTMVDTLAMGNIKVLDNPHRYAGFAVLKAPDIPSVLVEMGFLSNRKEADMLSKPDYRRKVVSSLMRGIETYFDKALRHERI